MKQHIDVIIIGAGASGLMCAIEAAKRSRNVLVLDHANKVAKKVLMSGGGRCNFTNYQVEAENYLSKNTHFCKSALSRFTQWDFLALLQKYNIPYHERKHGQLFCNDSARDIVNMLLSECEQAGVKIELNCHIKTIKAGFELQLQQGKTLCCESLVVATGGLSIPKIGASPLGYQIAEQFGIALQSTRAGLVPFTLQLHDKEKFSVLAGLALLATVTNKQQQFTENLLFTHRGLSGPVILQISSYWCEGESVSINLLPDIDLTQSILEAQQSKCKVKVKNFLATFFAKRLISVFLTDDVAELSILTLSHQQVEQIANIFHAWCLKPNGTEGYRTAEVTLGGVDCGEISSKTLEAKQVPGLYFIGEVLDVSGWLGGYNFQWAWASGWCAGQVV